MSTGRTKFLGTSTDGAKDWDTGVIVLEPQDVGWGLLQVPQISQEGARSCTQWQWQKTSSQGISKYSPKSTGCDVHSLCHLVYITFSFRHVFCQTGFTSQYRQFWGLWIWSLIVLELQRLEGDVSVGRAAVRVTLFRIWCTWTLALIPREPFSPHSYSLKIPN